MNDDQLAMLRSHVAHLARVSGVELRANLVRDDFMLKQEGPTGGWKIIADVAGKFTWSIALLDIDLGCKASPKQIIEVRWIDAMHTAWDMTLAAKS